MRKKSMIISIILLSGTLLYGCSTQKINEGPVDGVSSASLTHYEENSLSKEDLLKAMEAEMGSCTIATVNQDGTPNLIVAVPGIADENHIIFGWADNTTKANMNRTKQAVIAYYIYDSESNDKKQRYSGARIKVELEEDQKVLEKIFEDQPDLPAIGTVLKITELLPLG